MAVAPAAAIKHIGGLLQACKKAPYRGVEPHPGPPKEGQGVRVWNKNTVVLSPHSIHESALIPLRFAFLDLARTFKIWDEFGKLCMNSKKAAEALSAILQESNWSYAKQPVGAAKDTFFRDACAQLLISVGKELTADDTVTEHSDQDGSGHPNGCRAYMLALCNELGDRPGYAPSPASCATGRAGVPQAGRWL
jgi:hypothetical protein